MPTPDTIEKARIRDDEREHPTLFSLTEYSRPPLSADALCKKIGLNWMSAIALHEQEWLSFDPKDAEILTPVQEAELSFLGALVVAGCDNSVLRQLLARLPKPYAYRADRIYFDWSNQAWRLLEDTDDLEYKFDEWVQELIGWQEMERLQRLRTRVESAINLLHDRRETRVG